jgi:GR25 family glycosyltransferase involved in LPS biosynthesis
MELLKHTFFINLDVRQDRLAHVSNQLQMVCIDNPERFPAIQHEKGYIGCTQSHIRCLEMAIEREYEHVFICEDDILFLDIDTFKKSLAEFYNDDIPWDVLLIAGNNHNPFKVVKDSYMQIHNCQTTTGYVVKKHYYQELLNNFKESLYGLQNKLEDVDENGHYNKFALDRYWCKLQRQNNWFMLTPFTVIQACSYSDIEKRQVDYSCFMLNSE